MSKPTDHQRRCDVRSRERGFSLIELVVVLAVVAAIVAIVAPNTIRWQRDQRLKGAARDIADLLMLARSEATRTGDRHVVIYGPSGTTDPSGTPIAGLNGPVPLLVLDDGAPATSNCSIDAGEAREVIEPVRDVSWGVTHATVRAPGDMGVAAFTPPQASGGTFADPANNPVPWFLFRPDGVPVRFEGDIGDCGAIGATALGGGVLYLTNGTRDYAVVVSPMGGVRVHVWNAETGAWTT
jgi:prepilin-type N-terminal cleavage/methylation domain-containing protein